MINSLKQHIEAVTSVALSMPTVCVLHPKIRATLGKALYLQRLSRREQRLLFNVATDLVAEAADQQCGLDFGGSA